MSSKLANKTIREIESALSEKRSTAITEIISLIQQLAEKAFRISIGELSELIGRDPTITEKVISSANTLGYNPGGVPVLTISDAIHTIGFERVRNLAISLMLAENAARGGNTYDQRNAAALSVCSGMLAEELHRDPSDPDSTSELTFVCGSLRSYGRLLLSTFMLDQYRLARSTALDMPEEEAFVEVFGITPLDLGQHILEQTNLPRHILNTMRSVTKGDLRRPACNFESEVQVLSEMAFRVCSVVFDESVLPNGFNSAVESVLSQFSIAYPISLEAVNEALLSIDTKLSALNAAVGLSSKQSPASIKLQARIEGAQLPEPPPFAKISSRLRKKPIDEMDDAERKLFSDAAFAQATESIKTCLVPNSKFKLEQMFAAVSTAFEEAANLENCLIFVQEDFDSNTLSARHGTGKLFGKVKNRPLVNPDKKDIFSICLARKEDILIEDTNLGKIRSIVPEWIHAAGETSSFIVLPVNYQGELKSILVGTVSEGRKINLSEDDLKNLRSIRAMISQLYGMIEDQSVTAI